jgi:hypothetical protein
MQFDLWLGAPRDHAGNCVERDLEEPMKLVLARLTLASRYGRFEPAPDELQ